MFCYLIKLKIFYLNYNLIYIISVDYFICANFNKIKFTKLLNSLRPVKFSAPHSYKIAAALLHYVL